MESTALPAHPKVCFEVEEIIGVSSGVGNVKNYCVRWAPTWISGLNLVGCEVLINEFLRGQQQPKVISSLQKESDMAVDITNHGSVGTSVEQQQYSPPRHLHKVQGLPRQKNILQQVEQQQPLRKLQRKLYLRQRSRQKLGQQEEQNSEQEERYQGRQCIQEHTEQLTDLEQQHQHGQYEEQQQPCQQKQMLLQQEQQLTQSEPPEVQLPEEQSDLNQSDHPSAEQHELDQVQVQNIEGDCFQQPQQLQPNNPREPIPQGESNGEAESLSVVNGPSMIDLYPNVKIVDETVSQKECHDQIMEPFSVELKDQGHNQQKEQQPIQSWQQQKQFQLQPKQQEEPKAQHHRQKPEYQPQPQLPQHKNELLKHHQYVRISDVLEGNTSNDNDAGPALHTSMVKMEDDNDDRYVSHRTMSSSASWLGEEGTPQGACVLSSTLNEAPHHSKQYSLKPPPPYQYQSGSTYPVRTRTEDHLNGSFLHSDVSTNNQDTPPTTVKLLKCNSCDKSFLRECDLKHHIRMIHSIENEKKFSCNICNKKFSHHSSVVNHQKLHSGIKPYACAVCHAAFSRKDYLMKHFQRHTKEKPYVCIVCNKSFKRTDSLKQHVNKLHKNLTTLNNHRFHQQQ